jgi:hypothetical protein
LASGWIRMANKQNMTKKERNKTKNIKTKKKKNTENVKLEAKLIVYSISSLLFIDNLFFFSFSCSLRWFALSMG